MLRSSLKLVAILVAIPLILVSTGLGIAYFQQDEVVEDLIVQLNNNFKGRIQVDGSHISPFKNFPYVSIDLEEVQIFEDKTSSSEMLFHVSDAYIGFDLWDILNGNLEIKRIRLDQGFLSLVQHIDGSFNLVNALSSDTSTSDSSALILDLKAIELSNIDLLKFNEANGILAEVYIEKALSTFKADSEIMDISLDSRFLFNLIMENDTSFLHDKHVGLNTHFTFNNLTNELMISPSEVLVENALFLMEGRIDVDDNMDLDLSFKGQKPNFDLFLAFAPSELIPLLSRYDNGGQIYFNADLKGPSINGYSPKIDIDFGCKEAFVENTQVDKGVNDLFFKGHFTNGENRDLSTMSLAIEDFSARPETGIFKGNVVVQNFESPEIDMQLTCQFDLDFLAEFLDIRNLQDVSGGVSLEMNFHDIIDLSQPEKSIEKLNESYYTKLNVKNLNFTSSTYLLPVKDVNIQATMDGHRASIDKLDFKIGGSDMSINATVSDLPAILHHTDLPVEAELNISSSLIDINELTSVQSDTSGWNEQIRDLRMKLKFNSSARAFTESPNLPKGEFFIQGLHAQFSSYPHRLHDFNADVMIDDTDFNVIDFTGMIDESDFHFSGTLANYDLWFEEVPHGSTSIDFNLASTLIQLDDLFTYNGENYVPEDYRHEELRQLKLHGNASLEFNEKLVKTAITIDRVEANLNVHPMRFEEFKGRFIIDSTQFIAKDVRGKVGNSDFRAGLNYFFDADSVHSFYLDSKRLDFDQLFAYNPRPVTDNKTTDHDAGFNIFEVPFADMNFDLNVENLNYHRLQISNFGMHGRMQKNHFVYLDSMKFDAAGGSVLLHGYFNGSDPQSIYFSPNLQVDQVDLDQLLFKFENFGQDHLVSENLHGRLSGTITGKVHMHADMVPSIDDSELHMDLKVQNGSLDNYPAFHALSDYFTDKNLDHVRFDTLRNKLDLQNGKLRIPAMNINSSLGYFEISGEQDTDLQMQYFIRIPWKVVTKAGFQKLFGKKDQDNSNEIDEIQYRDPSKRTRFINLKIEGTPDDYSISLGKKKDMRLVSNE